LLMPARRAFPGSYEKARLLRKELTLAESKLWSILRNNNLNGANFRRQHAIGNYIVDFCSPNHKLIIELDGIQHRDQEAHDAERTAYLETVGFRVIRFWNSQVMNEMDAVIKAIRLELER